MEYECLDCLARYDEGELFTDENRCPVCGSFEVEPIDEYFTEEELEEAGEDMDECDFIS